MVFLCVVCIYVSTTSSSAHYELWLSLFVHFLVKIEQIDWFTFNFFCFSAKKETNYPKKETKMFKNVKIFKKITPKKCKSLTGAVGHSKKALWWINVDNQNNFFSSSTPLKHFERWTWFKSFVNSIWIPMFTY